jgi:hypothetical protein
VRCVVDAIDVAVDAIADVAVRIMPRGPDRLSARKNRIGPATRRSRRLRSNTEVGMEKMITRRSAELPAALRAAVRPTPVGMTSRPASTATELFGLQRVSASPESHAVDPARSMRLKATWMRTADGALVCRWIDSAEAEAS